MTPLRLISNQRIVHGLSQPVNWRYWSCMPELPEVETVRRGLEPAMAGAVFSAVETRRPDLRFPFPAGFAARLRGKRVDSLGRRGKYLIAALSSGESLVMHLGMSGRFTVTRAGDRRDRPGDFHYAAAGDPAHDHVSFWLAGPSGGYRIDYNDPRRFGFMDLVETGRLDQSAHFATMGPEPFSKAFTAARLRADLQGRAAPIKAALLDQSVVAGLGNIYACEALFDACISPRRHARNVGEAAGERLHAAILATLGAAIEAGGSTLRDFANADGALGYFQHRFKVYDREGAPCPKCGAGIRRIVQSGRSSFYCGKCQR